MESISLITELNVGDNIDIAWDNILCSRLRHFVQVSVLEKERGGEREGEGGTERERETESWCFKPSQPQRIISRLRDFSQLVGIFSPVSHKGIRRGFKAEGDFPKEIYS